MSPRVRLTAVRLSPLTVRTTSPFRNEHRNPMPGPLAPRRRRPVVESRKERQHEAPFTLRA